MASFLDRQFGEPLENAQCFLRERRALCFDPALEFGSAWQIEAGEKRSGVEPRGGLEVTNAHRDAKVLDVARELRVEPQLG